MKIKPNSTYKYTYKSEGETIFSRVLWPEETLNGLKVDTWLVEIYFLGSE